MKRSYKKIVWSLILIIFVLCSIFFYLFNVITPKERYSLVDNALGHRILANWHFVRKLPNIIHLPYWFKKTNLEEYRITINSSNLNNMNSHLPTKNNGMSYDYLRDEGKYYVKASFKEVASEYDGKIKIRVRGTNRNNWDAFKKAYRIKFDKENYFQGQRSLNLFLPYDRAYFGEILSSYRAKKFGIFSANFKFVRVYINNRDHGVYLASEPWSKELLAKNNIIDTNNIFSNKDTEGESSSSLFSVERLSDWKSYTSEIEDEYFEELDVLFRLIDNADNEEFAEKIGTLIDLDKFYSWQIINDLAGSTHQNDLGNSVLIFRKETGKFELVPWDVNMAEPSELIYKEASILVRRILSQDKFYKDYIARLSEYLNSQSNFEDDLKYYDNLYENFKAEFYNDQAKIHNDMVFNKWVKVRRQLVIDNFENAKKLTKIKDFPEKVIKNDGEKFEPIGSFKNFNDIFLSVDEFVEKYPRFFKDKNGNLVLPAGRHVFNEDIIIPQNLKFIINPGARLLFDKNISLISYSPIVAKGTECNKIIIEPSSNRPWGVFAVVNTGDVKNEFEYIEVNGGSEEFMNGIFFTSQFSLHNAVSEIKNSIFENSKSDDAVHAILGKIYVKDSVVRNNLSDGIDLDYLFDSVIENCIFKNDSSSGSNGDAIDFSGSDNVELVNNNFSNYGDKCISVGEKSSIKIFSNLISKCGIGIAVKDNSKVDIVDSIIIDNKESGISLYRKKQEFKVGGHAIIKNSILWDNGVSIDGDDLSFVNIEGSVVQGGFSKGKNIKVELLVSKEDLYGK